MEGKLRPPIAYTLIIILCAVLGYILAELWNVFRIVSAL